MSEEKQKMGILNKIFILIGVLATIFITSLILMIGALIIIKPYGVDILKVIPAVLDSNPTSSYDHPYLTTQQEVILESAGIDTRNLPTEITPAQQQCAVGILGQERVNQIVNGGELTVNDVLKAKQCFE